MTTADAKSTAQAQALGKIVNDTVTPKFAAQDAVLAEINNKLDNILLRLMTATPAVDGKKGVRTAPAAKGAAAVKKPAAPKAAAGTTAPNNNQAYFRMALRDDLPYDSTQSCREHYSDIADLDIVTTAKAVAAVDKAAKPNEWWWAASHVMWGQVSEAEKAVMKQALNEFKAADARANEAPGLEVELVEG